MQTVRLDGTKRRVTYVNEAFTRLTQFEPADVIGGSLAMLNGERTDPMSSDLLFEAVIATGSGNVRQRLVRTRRPCDRHRNIDGRN